jgi:hypothetical protein
MPAVSVALEDEYEAHEFDAVLKREDVVVCVTAADEEVSIVPLSKVSYIDGDGDAMLVDAELPDSFYGGGTIGFVDREQFPEIENHLDQLEREDY